jgi:hypothetical protein
MKKSVAIFTGILICVFLLGFGAKEPISQATRSLAGTPTVVVDRSFAKMPLYFIRNEGQVDSRVGYYIQGKDKTIYFTSEGLTYVLSEERMGDEKEDASLSKRLPMKPEARSRWVVKLDFVGGNRDVRPSGEEKTEAIISYFRGSPEDWKTGLPTYSRVVYRELWPGIDLVYYGTTDRLKYEFIVRPEADPSRIRLAYRGASEVEVNEAGRLEIETPVGSFEDDVPVAWQEVDGNKVDVAISYELGGDVDAGVSKAKNIGEPFIESTDVAVQVYGFHVGDYDQTQTLVLDPAVLIYCGYIGGTGGDIATGIAIDSAVNAYITGETSSTEPTFPETVGPDLTYNGPVSDAFVAKVNSSGTALSYCGYIGGSGEDRGEGIAIDSSGNAYVTGYTASTQATFPVKAGPDLTFEGGYYDAFVAKVNSSGTGLVYCGYIGGSSTDAGYGIAVDSAGNACVTGMTQSTEATFPVLWGPDISYNGGSVDAFVAKVNSSGTEFVYCSYIGGSADDHGMGIAADSAGNAYVIGYTTSTQASFPVKGGPDLTHNGATDAYVAKVDPFGIEFVYCGYIGGPSVDYGNGIAVDNAGNAYVTGRTSSTEAAFPLKTGPDLTHNGGTDAFVAKLNSSGTALSYCGYIGGSANEHGYGIAVDSAGNAYVTGETASTEATFPVMVGPDMTYNAGTNDAFVAKVNSSGTALSYCGYIGGSANDSGYGIAVDSAGNAYVTGRTLSDEATFPVKTGPDLTYNGGTYDAFVAMIFSSLTKNDFNLDGQEDILWRYYGSGGKNVVWYMQGAIRTGTASLIAVTDLNWQIVGTGDFNGDGWPDILWRYYGSGGKNCVWYMKGATRTGSASLPAIIDLNWQIVGTGDFNGDGWPDILWRYNGSGGKNCVWYMKGATRTATASLLAVTDLSWQIVGTGDFNRDGWPDILWRYNGSGGKDLVWFMQHVTREGTASLGAVTDLNWQIGGAGDFNGDGWPDILWRDYGSGGKNVVWYMQGATRTGTATLPAVTDLNWRIENH